MKRRFYMMICLALGLSACGGGGSSAPASSAAPSPTTQASETTLSGKITYDHVPHQSRGYGLDYARTSEQPARGIVVMLLDNKDDIIDRTFTDEAGNYSFRVKTSKDVKVQARARLLNSAESHDVKVTDNTLDNALFAMEGSLRTTGTGAAQTRDLHASSGWNGSEYSGERTAAPFAILNSVFDSIAMVRDVDTTAEFPPLEFRWSPDNRAIIGDKAAGHIGTSGFYRDENAVYLLGEAGRDTDEYDPHVIIHEWGHYFEHNLSRMDSMGGLHSLSHKLDPRLAFSEGWGNALAAIVTGDPNYKDSSGTSQETGFQIDFENMTRRTGWFSEGSVAAIIYDVFDDNNEGSDRISAGFAPIYQAATSTSETEAFTTLFTFSDALLKQNGINSSDYGVLLESQSVTSGDVLAKGESNNGAVASALPVYKEAEAGVSVRLCSVDDAGNYNKLGNRDLVFLNIDTAGDYEFTMMGDAAANTDPDFNIFSRGQLIASADSSVQNTETMTVSLSVGSYAIEAYEFYNINGVSDRRGDACFDFMFSPS